MEKLWAVVDKVNFGKLVNGKVRATSGLFIRKNDFVDVTAVLGIWRETGKRSGKIQVALQMIQVVQLKESAVAYGQTVRT